MLWIKKCFSQPKFSKSKIKFSVRCKELVQSIVATTCTKSNSPYRNGRKLLVICVNLTTSEIKFCFLHVAPEGSNTLPLGHLA